MSARAEELHAALKDDGDLQAKMVAATTDAERMRLFADAGYSDVSAADVRAAANPSGELSEDELSAAAGAGTLIHYDLFYESDGQVPKFYNEHY